MIVLASITATIALTALIVVFIIIFRMLDIKEF